MENPSVITAAVLAVCKQENNAVIIITSVDEDREIYRQISFRVAGSSCFVYIINGANLLILYRLIKLPKFFAQDF
jgi:hypothetical protein